MINEVFFNADSVREVTFGLAFTLFAFYIGRGSGRRREREAKRAFIRQLISLQSAVNFVANESDDSWRSERADVRIVFLPFEGLMNNVAEAAADGDVSSGNDHLEGALKAYQEAFTAFIGKRGEATYKAKAYRQLNDEMVDALAAVINTFEWRVRWGFVSKLDKLKFQQRGFLGTASLLSR